MFDPDTTVRSIKAMKTALDNAGLSPYLMTQPNGFHCPGAGKQGYLSCPEFPYGECWIGRSSIRNKSNITVKKGTLSCRVL